MEAQPKCFVIHWSEGEPCAVVASDFNAALELFVRWNLGEQAKELATGEFEPNTPDDIIAWIENVEIVAIGVPLGCVVSSTK